MARGGKRPGAGRRKFPSEMGNYEVGYGKPPKEDRIKPGEVKNPKGRPTAGASMREWLNIFSTTKITEQKLRRFARDRKAPVVKRAAAERMLRMIEVSDIADLQAFLSGEKTLKELRDEGHNTEVVKKAKITDKGGHELELHDRSGADFDRIFDRTEGKPKQALELTGNVTYTPAPVNKLALPPHLAEKMVK